MAVFARIEDPALVHKTTMPNHSTNCRVVYETTKREEGQLPGFLDHSQRALAKNLFDGKGCGCVLSFELGGADKAQVYRFMESLTTYFPATTLGDVYLLVLHLPHPCIATSQRTNVLTLGS